MATPHQSEEITDITDLAAPGPVPARHLYRLPEAMRLLSMKRSMIYEQIRAGRLRIVKEGRSTFITADAINEYVQLLITESQEVEYDRAS